MQCLGYCILVVAREVNGGIKKKKNDEKQFFSEVLQSVKPGKINK